MVQGNGEMHDLTLKRQIMRLEQENEELKRKTDLNSSSLTTSKNQKDGNNDAAFENLKKTNERLMQEIIRLNAKMRENNQSSFNDSMVSNSVYYN